VWAAFSLGATVLQRILASALVLTPMMESATPIVAAAVLAMAGVYQLTPLSGPVSVSAARRYRICFSTGAPERLARCSSASIMAPTASAAAGR